MAFDHFLIAPIEGGLQLDVRPFLIPDNAFARLNNAYIYRGRVRKRFGGSLLKGSTQPTAGYAQLQSRLRANIDTTDGGGNAAGNVPGNEFNIGQMFSVGDQIFTVYQNGAMYSTGAATGTFNTGTGAYTITGADPATAVYYYPALPVMGLSVLEQPEINQEVLVAFDTQFAYQYTASGFERLNAEVTGGAATWTGSNSDFFWVANYRGANQFNNILYVTNFNENEPNYMRFLNGTTWDDFRPQLNTTPDYLDSARIIVPFKNRLVALNTWETTAAGQNNYPQRARYSQVGSPLEAFAAGPPPTGGWREDVPGKGNAIDAATSEAIVTAEFIKDRLIVYFERSTWELVYLGNQAQPFTWQKINTELGAESTFSVVPFDKVALGVGNVGIHACNGSNVERIDEKIPDEVFEIHNNDNGTRRVYGVRDYFTEMVYWSFPDDTRDSDFPFNNKILTFNYTTGSWAFNDDSITCFGYFQQQNAGASDIWQNLTMEWQENTDQWRGAPLQGRFRSVIAGNQEGFVFIVDAEQERNAPALQITNVITTPATQFNVINHNLSVGDFVLIENMQGITTFNDNIYRVQLVVDENNFDIGAVPFVGTYTGGGTLTRVSRVDILTKQYNFYLQEGRNAYVSKAEFMRDRDWET